MPGQSATPIIAPVTGPLAETDMTAPARGTGPLPAELSAVNELLAADIAAMNRLIPAQLTSDVELVEEIGRYIVESGGKRLRPILVLLGTGACGPITSSVRASTDFTTSSWGPNVSATAIGHGSVAESL